MGRFGSETGAFQGASGVIQSETVPIQGVSPPEAGVSNRFTAASQGPKWYEFEACVPVNQSHKGLRVAGFLAIVSGAVALMYMGEDRVILASVLCMIGTVIIIPVPGLIVACCLWGMTAVTAVKKFNHRYLMQDTFSSARAIPDAIRTAPESKAGNAWRYSGAKLVNAMAAELGATCKDYSEVKARELSFYIGYQQADGRTQELLRKYDKCRLENVMLKEASEELDDLRKIMAEQEAEHKKRIHDLNTSWIRENKQLKEQIKALEAANAELVKAVPKEQQLDDVDAKLAHAYNVLHLSTRKAAEFAGTNPTRAYRYLKEHGDPPEKDKAL